MLHERLTLKKGVFPFDNVGFNEVSLVQGKLKTQPILATEIWMRVVWMTDKKNLDWTQKENNKEDTKARRSLVKLGKNWRYKVIE